MHSKTALITTITFLLTCASVLAEFVEVTREVGLKSVATWKYGGPTLADLNNDGRQDLVLGNHHEVPAQLFLSTPDNRFEEAEPVMKWDVHGIAAGDYDDDGWIDLVVSMGGGNGSNPQPPRLLHNTGSGFEDRTEAAGISQMGARGRSVRWIDPDRDGDLDLLQINARQIPGEKGPRNILFKNLGDGSFEYVPSPEFEVFEAERVLVTDLNGDQIPDLVTFTPLGIWIGDSEFQFTNASRQWIGTLDDSQLEHAMAVAEADIDNDGDMDIYVARGKTYYEIANNAVELDIDTGRMNLRDEGNKGQDAITFIAGQEVGLLDFFHWPRGIDITLPVYLGAGQTPIDTPMAPATVQADDAVGFPTTLADNGWYLGYLGENTWRLAWNLDADLAWDLRASVTGVREIQPHWEPQVLGVPDLLLINQGNHFTDGSESLPSQSADNNWGVITADFDNDSLSDFFVYRFGRLHGRVEDVLLVNTSGDQAPRFSASVNHGANNVAAGGHGDMGAPLDYDDDGWMDILSGSDDQAGWHLYRNSPSAEVVDKTHWIKVRVGKSPNGTGPHDAVIHVYSQKGMQMRRVGSAGTVHSQSLNNPVHFGLGEMADIKRIEVRWRDGTLSSMDEPSVDRTHSMGAFQPKGSSG